MASQPTTTSPRVGMLATVRNRRGVLSEVEPFDGPEGRLHVVTVEYTDPDGAPEDQLVWEREPGARLLEPNELPRVSSKGPMPHRELDALIRASRWTALTPFVDPDDDGPLDRMPLTVPFHGAVQIVDERSIGALQVTGPGRKNGERSH